MGQELEQFQSVSERSSPYNLHSTGNKFLARISDPGELGAVTIFMLNHNLNPPPPPKQSAMVNAIMNQLSFDSDS